MGTHLTNKELYDELSKTVYGHDKAKRYLITAFNRLRAYHKALSENVAKEDLPEKTNVLLVGDSGTGKTFMVNQLATILNIPFVELDASKFTSAGSVSGQNAIDTEKDVNTKLANHRKVSGTTSAIGIVYIDEIDKISSYYDGSSHNKWNLGVQGDFLKLIETLGQNNLVVFSGAFDNMIGKTVKKFNSPKSNVGFTDQGVKSGESKDFQLAIQDAVADFGFMPEMLGRMGLTVALDELTVKDYIKIARTITIPKLMKTIDYMGGKITIPLKHVKKIADQAMSSGQGVRYMKSKLSAFFLEKEFSLSVVIEKKEEKVVTVKTYDKNELDLFIKQYIHPDDLI